MTSVLESFLHRDLEEARKINAVRTEFLANPILTTPNLKRPRALADEYVSSMILLGAGRMLAS
ncbi:hypothetical protein F4802DRAFT_580751 [Xylaria palmicola]|nr:hypothetical protein F4802DRAFT_580751 [Xylaria palmicola]